MNQLVLDQQLDASTEVPIEIILQNIALKLETSVIEKSEIAETGFSFSASLKDISRYIITFLIEQSDLSSALQIIQNWERYVKALDNPALIQESDKITFSIFCDTYYAAIEYFKKQFLTHLGEKIEISKDISANHQVQSFIKNYGLKQRRFTYNLDQSGSNSIQIVNTSTIRTYEVKRGEREKVEMFNSIFLRMLIRKYEVSSFLQMLVQKFPELIDELTAVFNSAMRTELNSGDTLIEISPPFENYSYQEDCMVRIYSFNGAGFDVTQYAIPYKSVDYTELQVVTRNLEQSFGAIPVATTASNVYSSNNYLNQFFIARNNKSSAFLNSFPTIQEHGGIAVLEQTNDLVLPEILFLENLLSPFVVECINSPLFLEEDSESGTFRYKNIFLSAVATLDLNIHEQYPALVDYLRSGELVSAAVKGEDISQILMGISGGEISSLHIQANGYCDSLTADLGSEVETNTYDNQTIKDLKYLGKVTSLSKEADVELDLLRFVEPNGKEKKLFVCPICKQKGTTTYVDICDSSCRKCNVSLHDLRVASENKNLAEFIKSKIYNQSNTETSDGIFGVLFDLFGAVFSLF